MKKAILILLLFLFLFSKKDTYENSPGKISETGFRRLMEREWAREVFDLEEEEAAQVFGEDGEAYFL
ncbi:MAG: hypothetical protein E7580_02170 [Ruminococcaceae bacterium]|nr:hypothetical protein [Oscillospiraceae bacterium]